MDSGVPHLVCWVADVSTVPAHALGRRLRRDRRLGPAGANVDFVQVVRSGAGRALLAMRTYERGVEAETQACGTGAVAAAAAWVRRSRAAAGTAARRRLYRVDVKVPGGTLRVALSASRAGFGPAFLAGEARAVSAGLHPIMRTGGRQ
jgi:diaminopimelate epimerase